MTGKLLLYILAGLTGYSCTAQDIKEDFRPSVLNQPGQEYPQVNSQGYARFRIVAPTADSVRVSLGPSGRGGTLLVKEADGSFNDTVISPAS